MFLDVSSCDTDPSHLVTSILMEPEHGCLEIIFLALPFTHLPIRCSLTNRPLDAV
jgi:hypothetical protein